MFNSNISLKINYNTNYIIFLQLFKKWTKKNKKTKKQKAKNNKKKTTKRAFKKNNVFMQRFWSNVNFLIFFNNFFSRYFLIYQKSTFSEQEE